MKMSKERFEYLMSDEAYQSTDDGLTEKELADGYHFCMSWDGLLIGKYEAEYQHCLCEWDTKPDYCGEPEPQDPTAVF